MFDNAVIFQPWFQFTETKAHANKPVMGCLVPHVVSTDVYLLIMKSKENEPGKPQPGE